MVKNAYFQYFINPIFSQKQIDRKGRLPETRCTISRSEYQMLTNCSRSHLYLSQKQTECNYARIVEQNCGCPCVC
jgi:hypothetical protein